VQLGVVFDAFGDERSATDLLREALDEMKKYPDGKLVQLQSIAVYNLYVLTEGLEYVEDLQTLIQQNPDLSLPEVCYDVILLEE
jgi:hypothetical protein